MSDGSAGDERLLATAHQILKNFGGSKKVKDEMLSILSNYTDRFEAMSESSPNDSIKKQLDAAESIASGWESSSSDPRLKHQNSSSISCASYFSIVDEMLKLMEGLSSMVDNREQLTDRAENVLQLAMTRLEDEFHELLVNNAIPLHALHGSIDQFLVSGEGRNLSELEMDLVETNAMEDIREIAERMVNAGYEKECCLAYVAARQVFLNDLLEDLGMEKLSMDEAQKAEWEVLDKMMSNWSHGIRVLMDVVFPAESGLSAKIFQTSSQVRNICFSEAIKDCLAQIVNFAQAVLAGQRSPEKLFRILDMYSSLSRGMNHLQELLNSSEMTMEDARELLQTLAGTVEGIFNEFENAIRSDTARKAMQGGEIHPLTRYVMNYMNLLPDHRIALNSILENCSIEDREKEESPCNVDQSPLSFRLLVIISHLQSNLQEKANLYDDKAIQYIFLMNNLLYIIQKVKNSELRDLLGDRWIRKHRGLIRQYSTSYLRVSWSKLLACLKDEGISANTSSSNASKVALKERFKSFNQSFEEIYKEQTSWKVPDLQLREELRISVSEKVIPAYRSFLGRFRGLIESGRHPWKYIKYSSEDLENFLSDLFQGNPARMNLSKKR